MAVDAPLALPVPPSSGGTTTAPSGPLVDRQPPRCLRSHTLRKQIIVNSTPNEVRVALLENGVLAEIHIERSGEEAAAGNIYKGKVLRVLPGMQAAFVDLGLEKAGFLHASDVLVPTADPVDGEEVGYEDAGWTGRYLPIEKKVKPGDELVVQIAKEPLGTKGARISTQVSLPGRYLVYMPTGRQIGISKRIEDARERRRLRDAISKAKSSDGGIIARTSCEGLPSDDITADTRNLETRWRDILAKSKGGRAPALLHSDLVLKKVSLHFQRASDGLCPGSWVMEMYGPDKTLKPTVAKPA